jgi:hypothetical protein
MALVAGATSLPVLMLGGEPTDDDSELFGRWAAGMKVPNVRGLVAGRPLLYPSNSDTFGAVSRAAELVHKAVANRDGSE